METDNTKQNTARSCGAKLLEHKKKLECAQSDQMRNKCLGRTQKEKRRYREGRRKRPRRRAKNGNNH